MVYHYQGSTDLMVSAQKTGVPKGSGTTGTLWDAPVGGNRYGADAFTDDNGSPTPGTVQTGPDSCMSFTMDEILGATRCWLDVGGNRRWLLRAWEDYGPAASELGMLTATTGVSVASGRAPRLWTQATEPTTADGAVDGDWWVKTP